MLYPDGVIKGFVRISDREVSMDNLKYVGDEETQDYPGNQL